MRKNTILTTLIFLTLLGSGYRTAAQHYPEHSVLSEGSWFKMQIPQSGIYQMNVTKFPLLKGVSTETIGVFGQPGGMLTENNQETRPNDLVEMPIEIMDQNHNGIFDDGDYLMFYAEGSSKWSYSPSYQRITHQRNSYSDINYCYLTTTQSNQKRITKTAPADEPVGNIDSCTIVALIDNDLVSLYGSGRKWMGEKFSSSQNTRSFTLELPNLTSGCPILLHYGLASISTANSIFKVTCNGTTYSHAFNRSNRYTTSFEKSNAQSDHSVTIGITYQPNASTAAGYLDFIEANALVPNQFQSNRQQIFYNLQHIGSGESYNYHITNASKQMRVWDVTQYDAITEMALSLNGDVATFVGTNDRVRSYLMFDGSNYFVPSNIEPIGPQDLHHLSNPDLLIVTHPQYLSQSNQLAQLHEVFDNLTVAVVTDQQVYNEFSSGRQDPMAIREILRMFEKRAQADPTLPHPRYLLLFGKGTYDNRNLLGLNQTTIVTYQSEESYDDEGNSFCSDQMFGYLTDGANSSSLGRLDVGIGRLPAKNTQEANLLVSKISDYITRKDLTDSTIRGDWRNSIALLADDADPTRTSDVVFVKSADHLADSIKLHFPNFNIDKIYADAFQQQSGAIGSFYPDVNNALRQRINYGCLLLNYIGHGSDTYIGTERYMELQDMSNYSNVHRLPVFITSTCSFGKYDMTEGICGAEGFILAPNAGIAVISAARPITHNEAFNTPLCTYTLTPGYRIGDALREAKNKTYTSPCITLLGDPALSVSIPQNEIVITHINGEEVVEGQADSAEVLSIVTIEGEVRDADGNRIEDFDGEIYPIVYDRPMKCKTLANDNEGTEVTFEQQKSVLFKSREVVKEGRFNYQFTIPRDVAYEYAAGKLSHYAKSGNLDAWGSYNRLYFGGFDTTVDLSEHRPTIRLFMNDTTFRDGGMTNESPRLYAILEDPVGINAVGSGLGHDITAILDGNPNSVVVLNDFYETDVQNSHRGYVNYAFDKLTEGHHTITLKAWNIYNYSNSATLHFYVQDGKVLLFDNISVHPNPARNRALIRAEHNGASAITRAVVQIFDHNGQSVKTIELPCNNESYVVETLWDLCSDGGGEISDGVYVARIILYTQDGNMHTQTTKIVKMK